MLENSQKILSLLSTKERKHLTLLIFSLFFIGIFETLGIAIIMPFMAIAATPEIVESNLYLSKIYSTLKFSSYHNFTVFVGCIVLVTLVIGNTFSGLMTWMILRFSFKQGQHLSKKLLTNYLSQPYAFYLKNNSSRLSKNLLSEIERYINGVLTPSIQAISRTMVVSCILCLLVIVDPYLAIGSVLILGPIYCGLYLITRKKISNAGILCSQLYTQRFGVVSEAFGGIKDVKIIGCENLITKRYDNLSQTYAKVQAQSQVVPALTKYLLETIAFGSIIIIVLYLLSTKNTFVDMIPLLSVYAFSGYRLMPSLQQIFQSISSIKFNASALNILTEELQINQNNHLFCKTDLLSNHSRFQYIQSSICLDKISFTYPEAKQAAIPGPLNLNIKANTTVGFVGSTGSGKTTIVDIILGLHAPTTGSLIVDDQKITKNNLRAWQNKLSYVPQTIFLIDDTITKNIAFGIPDHLIDHSAVEAAAQKAQLHDFICNDLPLKYETIVGERGIRLSGGQRQRIGIARALYSKPDVLILDEATSALDGITEIAIMKSIEALTHTKTIIIIAHRLSTVKSCDNIFIIDKGEIVQQGTFTDLIESNYNFKKMANHS